MATFLWATVIFIAGLALGMFLARYVVKKEIQKNPPITEDMISAMLKGMGQPATKKRVNQIMKQMKEAGRK